MELIKVVLYAEDDPDDRTWVSEACKALNVEVRIEFLDNGKHVFQYLSSCKPAAMPSLIVLDLNMPELDGRQTLQKIREHPNYRHIPVAIVTTSSNAIDREVCNRLGANLFLTKPDSHTQWQQIVRELEPFIGN
ncbi:MAG TPA: response regulator [Flavisolibacter sp.]